MFGRRSKEHSLTHQEQQDDVNKQIHSKTNHPASEDPSERDTQKQKRGDLVKGDGQQGKKWGTDS